jgi:hypothetical protein
MTQTRAAQADYRWRQAATYEEARQEAKHYRKQYAKRMMPDGQDFCATGSYITCDTTTITITYDEATAAKVKARKLEASSRIWADVWSWGAGIAVFAGTLGLGCIVGTAFTWGASCAGALFWGVVGGPAVGKAAGDIGGGIAAEKYDEIEDALGDMQLSNKSTYEINITKRSYYALNLPGNVGIQKVTEYIIEIPGHEPIYLHGFIGRQVIYNLFGVWL